MMSSICIGSFVFKGLATPFKLILYIPKVNGMYYGTIVRVAEVLLSVG